jgi:carboxypeptidase Q
VGCKNVHLEPWGTYPVGFDRGRKSFARMTSPSTRVFEFTSPSWSEGTRGAMKGLAVKNPKTQAEFEAVKGSLKGAWVIMDRQVRRARPGAAVPSDAVAAEMAVDALVDAAGIAGRVTASRSELVITSGSFRDKTFENHPTDRTAIVRKSDMDAILKEFSAGKPVTLEINLDQKWRRGPVVNSNIIAEIPGTDKSDEVIIISGHFDSWDGPGSNGVSDNATGSVTALEAARILNKVGFKPRRTIRFVLWTGEEQGLYGSRAYVIQHEKELGKMSGVFVDDGGSNYHGGFSGHPSMRPLLETVIAQTAVVFPDLPMKFTERVSARTSIGSDQDSFNAVGVPGFFSFESSVGKYGAQDYNFIHHTQHDSLKYVIPTYLQQTAFAHACTAYVLGNAEMLLPRYPVFDYKLSPDSIPGFMAKPGR